MVKGSPAMAQQRLYDKDRRRLVYLAHSATARYWDERWQSADLRASIEVGYDRWLLGITQKYIPDTTSRILEGGCGQGAKVNTLHQAGYKAIGVDYASRTVQAVKQVMPALDLREGDVRKLDFADHSFEGYWSLGVIEHFWDGYDDILGEANRVLTPGGYLFLTFPQLSPFRRLRARCGGYRLYKADDAGEPENFYQFALDRAEVKDHLAHAGFEIIKEYGEDGCRGLKDDLPMIGPALRPLAYGQALPWRVLRRVVNWFTASCFGHIYLVVARKIT